MSGKFQKLWMLVMLGVCASSTAFAREGGSSPQVRGAMMRDFVRLTFEWPEPTLFTAKTSGNTIILTFDRKANPNMGAVLKQLHPYITSAERKADGRTILLTLDKPHRIRTFISDNISGIDLLDVGTTKIASVKALPHVESTPLLAEKKTAAKTKEKPPVKQVARKQPSSLDFDKLAPAAGEATPQAEKPVAEPAADTVAAAPAEPAKEEPATEVAQAEEPAAEPATAAALAAAEPVKEEPAPAPEAKTEEKTEPAKEPAKEEAAKEAPKPDATIKAEALPEMKEEIKGRRHGQDSGVSMVPLPVDDSEAEIEAQKAEAEKAPADKNAEEKTGQAEEAAPTVPVVESAQDEENLAPLTSNKVVVSADTEGATLRFPLKERTAMAVFIRANILWVVLDKKLDLDLADFEDLPQTVIGKATLMPNDKMTIFHVPINDNIYPSIKQQEGQMDVAILLSASEEVPDAAMDVTVNTDPPALPYVFLPALEVGNTIEVADPVIGDTLSITPFFTREQGLTSTRNFVEFTLLESTQGLAIAKKADATTVTATRNGLRISLPNGAHLSAQATMEGAEKMRASLPASATLFPDDLWALDKGKSYKLTMRNLFNQTVFAPNEGAKNLARLRMAQIYLRDGFVVEALGLLDAINRTNPSYYRSAKLASMRGAANFLLYRFNDASRDFAAAELNNNPEAEYWRNMLADLLGNPSKPYDFLEMNKNYISKYPPVFRQRLAIVAADRLIAAKEYNSALKIFDGLSEDNIIAPIQPYVDYLTAKISSDNGQEQEANEVWKRLAEDGSNKFVQARATFSEILSQLDNNVITREQAIDRLERLRLGWHGDGLELQVVQLLGDLYVEQEDYVNAMRVWQIGVTGFRNTGPAIDMARRMEDVFVKLFNEGIADKMTPLEALALYYEYRRYSPPGVVGTQMIEKLAGRLVGVDLLTTAAQLLEQQMRTQMEKSERSRVGAKLAEIYLMNNQPKKALKALQDSVYGDNPILLRIKRNQLTARSMMLLNKPDEALIVLGQDESVGAEKLRAMIYWEQKDWPGITTSIENIFKKRPDPATPLTGDEGEFVLRLALAHLFQGDESQLQYMRDYFGPLMRDHPAKAAFDFITAPDVTLTTRNFDDLLKSLSNTRDFISGYEARMALADTADPVSEIQ